MPNLNAVPMICTWCGRVLSLCECPASLARDIDEKLVASIRERNELKLQLQAAREQIASIQAREQMASLAGNREMNELRAALLAARREVEARATLARENREMWNAIETALGHMREPFLLMDARYARERLTEAYNTLQKSRARAALAAMSEPR